MSTDSSIRLVATSGFRPKTVSRYLGSAKGLALQSQSNGHRQHEYLRYLRPLTAWNHSSQQVTVRCTQTRQVVLSCWPGLRSRNRGGLPFAQHAWMLSTGSFAMAAPFTHHYLLYVPRISRVCPIDLVLSPSVNFPTVKHNCPGSCLEHRATIAQLSVPLTAL